eukprot:TRINITY_DN9547_c0_g2_i1.p1 TRINITY_DN9547_c0_g2~~TRINITY_DN9547_c0_g2_i1.p1  ORF type:complete len:576 (+),score=103.11 TRINITY_DN9547_c0_g2_i1:35-1762(+)
MDRSRRGSSPPANAGRVGMSRSSSPPRQRRASQEGYIRRPPVPSAREFPALPGLSSMPLEALSIGAEIGKGRFKHVHQGILQGSAVGDDSQENRDVVVLRYPKGKSECKTELQVLSLLALKSGAKSFVPIVFGTCDQGRDLIVVQERATSGSLKAVLTEKLQFSASHGLRAALQVCRALKCLGLAHVVHADLSCRNILVFRMEEDPDSIEVKVTDFGLSVILKDDVDHDCRKQPQATRWCSPETVAFQKLSHRSDVWSFGALLWELFSGGQSPWALWQRRTDVAGRLKNLAETGATFDAAEDFPRQYSYPASAQSAILSCLRVCENHRPSISELENTFAQIVLSDVSPPEQGCAAEAPLDEAPEPKSAEFQASSAEIPTYSDLGTPSTSATPTMPPPEQKSGDGQSLNLGKTKEDRIAALLAEQEARLERLQHEEELRLEQLECLERSRFTALNPPFRDTATPLTSYGVPQQPGHAAVLRGGNGVWMLSSVEGGALRRREFLDKEDAWAAFVESADSAVPCHLRDPTGSNRASSSWICADQALRAQPRPMWVQASRLSAWLPSIAVTHMQSGTVF